jgi:hypothetical protein
MTVPDLERALLEACRRGHAEVIAFTVAPRSPSPGLSRGGDEWLVEFAEPPRAPETFVRVLDEALQRLDTAYRARRAGDGGMLPPRVLEMPAGTFYRWMRERGTPGNEHTAPRVTHDRTVAEALLRVVAARTREPLIAVGS